MNTKFERSASLVVLVTLCIIQCSYSWHGYNYSYTRLEDRSECPSFEDATRPYSFEFVDKLSLWPNLMSHFDVETGESLYGSKEALEIIWKNQNPEDCSTAKYLVSGGWPYGFGSRIHMEGETIECRDAVNILNDLINIYIFLTILT